MNHIVKESLLFDLYGDLLTEKKRSVMALYHEENLSLTEIAEEFEVSRAAVYDSLKSAESKLAGYEEKLGMVRKLEAMSKFCKDLTLKIAEIEMLKIDDSMLEEKLGEMQEIVKEQYLILSLKLSGGQKRRKAVRWHLKVYRKSYKIHLKI